MLETDGPDGLAVHGPAFECFRDSEVSVGTLEAQAPHMVDATVAEVVGGGWRRPVTGSQLRWPGLGLGLIRLATEAIVNAARGLYAKVEPETLWKLRADTTPKQLVVAHSDPHRRRARAKGRPSSAASY